MHAYLSQRLQKTEIGSTFSELMSILFGVPQGSVLGSLLFIIYICDLFILNDHLAFGRYADDTTPFVYGENFDEILDELGTHMAKISEWVLHNCLKVNAKKFHFFLSPFVDKAINIENFTIKSSCPEVLLGVKIGSNLSFSEHVTYLCATANRKLHALSLVSKYISLKQRRILLNSFIISPFRNCPLIWMTYSRGLNNKINHIDERALRIIYKDFSTSFEELLAKDKSVTIHNRILQQLAIKIFKVKMGISPIVMKEIFNFSDSNNYNLRSSTHLSRPIAHTTHYETGSTTNLGAKIWKLLPQNIKEENSLSSFKTKVKKWISQNCPCRLSKHI